MYPSVVFCRVGVARQDVSFRAVSLVRWAIVREGVGPVDYFLSTVSVPARGGKQLFDLHQAHSTTRSTVPLECSISFAKASRSVELSDTNVVGYVVP